MAYGTAWAPFKAAFITLLAAEIDNVSYSSPVTPQDFDGIDGSKHIIFWDDDASATTTIEVFKGLPTWYDETIEGTLVVQAIGVTTDDTQQLLDERADATIYAIRKILQSDPTCGIASTESLELARAEMKGYIPKGGVITDTGIRGARYEITIQIEARLKVEN